MNVVPEYEIFRNEANALAFFFTRVPNLDGNAQQGPFWFVVRGDAIHAGTEAHHAVFEGVQQDVIDTAKQRGAITLIEFENQQPVRATPCYFAEHFT